MPDRTLELTVGERVSAAAWREALAIAPMFVRRVGDEDGFCAGFDVCKAEVVRHVALSAERVGRHAVQICEVL